MCTVIIVRRRHASPRVQVLHRDFKALNTFITETFDVRLGDLGVAKVLAGKHCLSACKGSSTSSTSCSRCQSHLRIRPVPAAVAVDTMARPAAAAAAPGAVHVDRICADDGGHALLPLARDV